METWISSRRGLGGDMLYLPYWLEGISQELGRLGKKRAGLDE